MVDCESDLSMVIEGLWEEDVSKVDSLGISAVSGWVLFSSELLVAVIEELLLLLFEEAAWSALCASM